MDQWQQAPLLTAEILLLSITATFLFVRFNLRVRQSWSALGSTQQRHVIACAVGFTLWVARKHLSWYSNGLKESKQFRYQVVRADSASEQMRLTREFFGQHAGDGILAA